MATIKALTEAGVCGRGRQKEEGGREPLARHSAFLPEGKGFGMASIADSPTRPGRGTQGFVAAVGNCLHPGGPRGNHRSWLADG